LVFELFDFDLDDLDLDLDLAGWVRALWSISSVSEAKTSDVVDWVDWREALEVRAFFDRELFPLAGFANTKNEQSEERR
jgi:hypothetical protein